MDQQNILLEPFLMPKRMRLFLIVLLFFATQTFHLKQQLFATLKLLHQRQNQDWHWLI
jgi:hypothetical protein